MDLNDETRKFKWMLYAFILFIASAIFSYSELKYFLYSKTAQAQFQSTKIVTTTGRWGSTRQHRVVEYTFLDNDNFRRESDSVAMDWQPPPSPALLTIQYVPNSPGKSRLPGHLTWIWIVVFLASVAWLSWWIYRVAANKDP